MRIVVVTYGTEGDARPLAALCGALLNSGHEPRLLADRGTLGAAESLGISTTALAGDIRAALQPNGSIAGVVAKGSGFASVATALARIANASAESWMKEIVAAGRDCDAVVVSGLAAFVGLSAAEYLRVKAIGTGFIPITPTSEFPSPFLPPTLPHFLNHASHVMVNGILWHAFRKATNAARARVCGLPPRRKGWTSHPMLYGISPSLVPRPNDWPDNALLCGQWVPPAPQWSPPRALSEFLAAGEPPMYVGFGSMSGFDRPQLLNALIGAVAGRRALFYPGWSGVHRDELPDNFFLIGDTPHGWLFPKTSLVIHHGGSGTSHSAARAGVPSVVVPFTGDQHFWASRLTRIGVAPEAVKGRRLRAAALARGIESAGNEGVRSNARAVAERMREETGLRSAVAAIEAILRR